MRLYFLRHGIAAKRSKFVEDAKRALTPKGREKTAKVVRGLKRLNVKPDVILTSPLQRAAQTAQIAAEGLGRKNAIRVCDALKPGSLLKTLFQEMKPYASAKEILLVGHEPTLSEMASELISGNNAVKLGLKKAGALCVDIAKFPPVQTGTLLWFMKPKQLRHLK